MYKIVIIPFVLALLLSLLSCNGSDNSATAYPPSLLKADTLATTVPDSAAAYLDGLADAMTRAGEATLRYYQLLTVKAHYRSYHPQPSDTIIYDVLSYYQDRGDTRHLPEAYYYAGRVTRTIGDATQALHFFHQALDHLQPSGQTLPADSASQSLQGVIHAQMGYLFRSQDLFDEALNSTRQAFLIDSLLNDSVRMVLSLLDMGQCYRMAEDYDQALSHLRASQRLALECRDTLHLFSVISQEAFVLIKLDSLEAARTLLADAESRNTLSASRSSIHFITANLFARLGAKDSAAYYYRKVTEDGVVKDRASAYLWLGDYALQKQDVPTAITLLKRHVRDMNTLTRSNESEAVAAANALYNYQLRERQNAELRLRNSQYRYTMAVSIAVAIIVFILLLWALIKRRNDRRLADEQLQRLQFLSDIQCQEKDRTYRELQGRLASLTLLDRQTELHQEMAGAFMANLHASAEYAHLHDCIVEQKPLSDDDFVQLNKLMYALLPDFVNKLHGLHYFKDIEWRVSLLIKMGINQSDIAILLGRSQSGISSIRRRLYQKVFRREGSCSDWDNFLLKL